MRRVINKHGLRFLIKETIQELSARNKEKRLAYATAMKNYNWKTVVFSDEKTFYLGAMTNRAWQVPGRERSTLSRDILKRSMCGPQQGVL